MKKLTTLCCTVIALSFFALLSFSCGSLGALGQIIQQPKLSMNNISIGGLDLEGITFNADYSISNPYGVAFSIAGLTADVRYENGTFTTLKANEGVTVAANATQKNSVSFKVPYDSILNFAKSASGKKSLPFSFDGTVSLDVSSIPALSAASNTFDIPFAKAFEVPVVKPKLSVSNVSIKMPTLDTLKNAFTQGGVGVLRAASLASSILTGSSVSADVFDGIDLNLDLLFDVNVGNEGSAPWEFAIKNCSLKTLSGELADVGPAGDVSSISSSGGTIPMKASLNTLQASAFVAQILNKKGTNPVFNLESGLSFPETKYASNIPLAYSYEIPLSSISKK